MSMHTVKVESAMAALVGRQVVAWEGEVEIHDDCEVADEARLEFLFRFFNRVVTADSARLEAIGYRLPSLSVGDTLTVDGRSWLCESVGWRELNAA